ncbi:hypothetical protein QR685DRAFT_451883 [Neurospora intermedia]|uniref:Uncharacterized protein n=1 Tax=Neurospora intermedia TaxID=5142 RepID=A0ABR3D0C1_NEUIN
MYKTCALNKDTGELEVKRQTLTDEEISDGTTRASDDDDGVLHEDAVEIRNTSELLHKGTMRQV